MGCPVIITPQARRDLREIVAFIARNNPERARSFAKTLANKALALGSHPEIGRVLPEQDSASVREIVHGAYRIIYELVPEPTKIFVLRFWHGARGTPELLM